jgi:YebC/PmpR family DNA-binding regulatory protein
MSGHSKWATIRRDKESNDNKKGAAFTKLSKDISLASKAGGIDPSTNSALSIAIAKAKEANMPNDKIQKAIDRGTGINKSGAVIHKVVYEAYGPGDVGLIIDAATDNKNRTVGEVRTIIEKNGGRFVEGGAVSWLFESKGWIFLPFENAEEKKKRENSKWGDKNEARKIAKDIWEEFELELIENDGILDIQEDENGINIYTTPENLGNIRKYIEQKNVVIDDAYIVKKAKTEVDASDEIKEKIANLVSKLEDYDDVEDVWVALS